ncbi:MAG: hypothetical protein WCK35_20620 [Chloroflexota bacterium]
MSSGTAQSDIVYPVYQTPSTYDGPYAENTGWPPLDAFLVATDIFNIYHYQSSLPAQQAGNFVYANVNYELRTNNSSPYTVVTSLQISNHTDSVLSLDMIKLNNKIPIYPNSSILIKPDQVMNVQTSISVFGESATLTVSFSSPIYTPIFLPVSYP